MDAALAKAGEAFDELVSEFGANPKALRINLPEAVKVQLRGALYHWAPHMARMMYVDTISHQFRVPLARSMEGLRTKEVEHVG